MRNRVLKSAWLLAVCLPTLALAQEPRGEGTWEWSAGAGIKIQDSALQTFLARGSAATRFTSDSNPGRLMPSVALRLGYNFTKNLGWSIGGEVASGSGVTDLTPFTALTATSNLTKLTSSFMTVGTQITRVVGSNGRRTHPTWGAHLGFGIRRMLDENLAIRLEGRLASEHYAQLPEAKATYPAIATIGLSYFVAGRRLAR
jgi:hypothetical protein